VVGGGAMGVCEVQGRGRGRSERGEGHGGVGVGVGGRGWRGGGWGFARGGGGPGVGEVGFLPPMRRDMLHGCCVGRQIPPCGHFESERTFLEKAIVPAAVMLLSRHISES
jgi:hypothetical protein